MKIEIIDIVPKVEETQFKIIEPDFSSINKLRGNKFILDFYFQNQKLESLNDGKES